MKRFFVSLMLAAGLLVGSTAGVADAIPPSELNGSVTDASTDIEVATDAYRDLTMNRLTHREARAYVSGSKSAVRATRSLNNHLHRYCAAARMISHALSDQGYRSVTIQNFYHRSGCLKAPAVTHHGPRS